MAAFAGVFGPGHWLETVGEYAVIGLSSEIMSSGLPEEQAQWDWLETVPGQVGDRPVLVFCHKPVWPSRPGPEEDAVAIPGAERYRLLRILAGLDVKIFANGHLHQFTIGQYGSALTVTAPSVAFAKRETGDVTGPGLQQVGVVEYTGEGGDVGVFFRSVPGLTEGSIHDVEQALITAEQIGVTL